MTIFFGILVFLSITLVAIVLTLGLYSLARGGSFSQQYSNRLMRWRVTLQIVAVLILVLAIYIKKNHMG